MLPEDMQDAPDDATRSLVASAAARCPAVVARDASYAATGYRSFEFASFEACVGEVVALVSTDVAAARDLALACAGLVRPTSGSLVVDGVELARRPRRLHRASLPCGLAGVGVFSGLFDIDAALTVEQVVRRELELRCDRGTDALEYLSQFGLATHAGRYVSDLEPAARIRLSCALACAGGVRVAVVDADDRFCYGASVADVRDALELLCRVCAERGICALVATGEPALADACDGVCPLDIGAAERLAVGRDGETEASPDGVPAEPERGRVA
ncbi:hypothetical protein [Collinsella tanakaei]|uniref:hypothetical protein n=1 Tax=Collinsella tanakaei TaxID=626935 RepID=UPI0025A431CF|nr:hypothetical protein [Collinsella tanakaei]MDM8300637.1 hypothetical protein [Collinsella tanakaei]